MIIKCEKCQTKFRLDDSRVTDRGVKVRCTKCKYVFTVRPGEPEVNSVVSGELPPASLSTAVNQTDADQAAVNETKTLDVPTENPSFQEFTLPDTSAGDSSKDSAAFEPSAFSFPSDDSADAADKNISADAGNTAYTGGEVDFSAFDFGDSEAEPDATPVSMLAADDFAEPALTPVETKKEAPQGLDFSDDDMFGAVVQAAPDTEKEPIVFDFEDSDSFAESMDVGGDSVGKDTNAYSLDNAGEAPFNLGEIDFGDELTSVAVQQVNPEDLKPSQEILFAPLAEALVKPAENAASQSIPDEESAGYLQQDLPPLSITSRRKQSPFFFGIIAVSVLLLLTILGYFGFSTFSIPKEAALSVSSGKIATRTVTSSYIDNDEAGELLVISGEALNEYPKSRAALQVSVTVFDSAGQAVATKSAYCGNPLTKEQLETLTIDKIEASMSNQFGDSLANMEVAPGKAIPFVVVLANIPGGAKDFSVQSAGSTVATGKQQ